MEDPHPAHETRNVGPVNLGRRVRRRRVGELRWPFISGTFAEGAEDFAKAATCMILSGPFDGLLPDHQRLVRQGPRRDLETSPTGRGPIHHVVRQGSTRSTKTGVPAGLQQVYFLLFGGLALAFGCDVWAGHNIIANPLNSVGLLACFGALVSYLYSAPPYKLKAEGWRGSFALGASYIALPWWCGQAMFGHVGEGAAGGELTPASGRLDGVVLVGRFGNRDRQRLQELLKATGNSASSPYRWPLALMGPSTCGAV